MNFYTGFLVIQIFLKTSQNLLIWSFNFLLCLSLYHQVRLSFNWWRHWVDDVTHDCTKVLATFRGIVGKYVMGHVEPATSDVIITITEQSGKIAPITLQTTDDGSYRWPTSSYMSLLMTSFVQIRSTASWQHLRHNRYASRSLAERNCWQARMFRGEKTQQNYLQSWKIKKWQIWRFSKMVHIGEIRWTIFTTWWRTSGGERRKLSKQQSNWFQWSVGSE